MHINDNLIQSIIIIFFGCMKICMDFFFFFKLGILTNLGRIRIKLIRIYISGEGVVTVADVLIYIGYRSVWWSTRTGGSANKFSK